MRVLPTRPALLARTQKRLRKETAAIEASRNPKETAERQYASARKAKWFRAVIGKLGEMAGSGEPCMYCDANESTGDTQLCCVAGQSMGVSYVFDI